MQVADAVHKVTRDDVVARVAAELGVDAAAVTAAMYADLEGEQVMTRGPDIEPEALLHRYNLALAQAVLLRATSMTVEIAKGDPQRYRQLFRYVKFYRLMHQVTGTAKEGYRITLDGPMSLFQLSQKYGLQLAEFLPALLLCEGWRPRPRCSGARTRSAPFAARHVEQGLVSHYPDTRVYVTREEQWLLDRFADLATSTMDAERRGEVVDLGGRGVLIPDFVLRHKTDGRVACVEIVGFWKREYLEARLALLKAEGPKNLILAVPWRLRGADDDLEDAPGEVMFFKDVIIAKELLERAERVGKR